MRTLVITPIWPNRLDLTRATYNGQQFGALARLQPVRVLNSLPWFPFSGLTRVPHRAARDASVPRFDRLEGVDTWHVRQPYVPLIGNPFAVPLAVSALVPYLEHVRWCDVVIGTWAYPDGCASILLAALANKPCVVKVHGSDLNSRAKLRTPRRILRTILPRVDALVAVSRALGDEAAALGVPRSRITVVANGIDPTLFRLRDKEATRSELGIATSGRLLVFVGRVERAKGIGELLDAFERVRATRPDLRLALVGDGELMPEVARRKASLGDALIAVGARPFTEVPLWMGAADVFVLPSWREGTPNALLEAIASGRPCVGSDVGGIPDVLADPRTGLVHRVKDTASLAEQLGRALDRRWDPEEVRACSAGSWADSARRLRDVLDDAVRARRSRADG